MATNYERGRRFEYRTRDKLKAGGAEYVMRAAGSHTVADLAAFWPLHDVGWERRKHHCEVWLVQCKRDGRLPASERESLIETAEKVGAIPVLAKAGPKGRGVEFDILTGEDIGRQE